MKTLLISILLLLNVTACELPPKNDAAYARTTRKETGDSTIENEEYVMVTTAVTMPMYVHHDQAAFKKWG